MNRNPHKRGVDDMRARAADYLADALNAGQRARFEEELERNEDLRALTEDLRALWVQLPDRSPERAPTPIWPLVRSRLSAGRRIRYTHTAPRWRMAVSFAAGVVVGILAWSLVAGGLSRPSDAEVEIFAHESLFETLDPIPPESVGGLYFAAVPVERDPDGGPR